MYEAGDSFYEGPEITFKGKYMSYSLRRAFEAYVTLCEHYRNLETYRRGAKVIRKGLPEIDKSKPGWRDIMEVKNFVEFILTEEDSIVEMVAQDDGASTIMALTPEANEIILTNTEDIDKYIFEK